MFLAESNALTRLHHNVAEGHCLLFNQGLGWFCHF